MENSGVREVIRFYLCLSAHASALYTYDNTGIDSRFRLFRLTDRINYGTAAAGVHVAAVGDEDGG